MDVAAADRPAGRVPRGPRFYPFPRSGGIAAPAAQYAPYGAPPPWTAAASPLHVGAMIAPPPQPPPPLPPTWTPQAAHAEVGNGVGVHTPGMKGQAKVRARAPRPRAPGLTATGKQRGGSDLVLPAREEAASRAEERERRVRRHMQDRRFGAYAADVRTLEARLNRAFDLAVRTTNPPLWPSVALRSASGVDANPGASLEDRAHICVVQSDVEISSLVVA